MELDISGARIFFTLPIDVPVLGPLRISETMVVSWIVMILITGLCIWLTHDLKEENISKRQAVAELIVEKANSFVIGNMGEKFRYLIPRKHQSKKEIIKDKFSAFEFDFA